MLNKLKKYLNKNYDVDKYNCYSLIVDVYATELNIILPITQDDCIKDIINKNKRNFYLVNHENDNINVYDICYFKKSRHVGIFVDTRDVLHCEIGLNTSIGDIKNLTNIYGDYMVFRYKEQ